MIILHKNLLDSSTLYASSQESNFPVSYLQDARLIKQWRSLNPSAQWVVIDAGVGNTIAADSFSIISHNISSSATITIEANTIDDWTSPPLSDTITYDADIMIAYFSTQTYRYFRLYVDDPLNTDGYISIGRLYLCLKSTFSNPTNGFEYSIEDTTIVSRSITKQVFADKGVQTYVYKLSWGYVSDSVRQQIKGIYNIVGQWDPIVLIPDQANTDKLPPIYAVMMQGVSFTNQFSYTWRDAGMIFEEAK